MKLKSTIKTSLLLALMPSVALPAWGELNLTVRSAAGGEVVKVYPLVDETCLTFDTTGDMIVSGCGDSQRLRLTDGMCLTFENGSGISVPGADAVSVAMLYDRAGQTVAFTGIDGEMQVTLYDAGGRQVCGAVYSPGGTVSVSSVATGVYIVKVGGYSFKFIK